jgi:hypothetical protein
MNPISRVIAVCHANVWLCLSLLIVASACSSNGRRFDGDSGGSGAGQGGSPADQDGTGGSQAGGSSGQGGNDTGGGGTSSGQGGQNGGTSSGAGAGGQNGGTSGGAGAGGQNGGAASCGSEGAACELGTKKGLCRAGACGDCEDSSDDAACAAAYGAGYACAGGVCQIGGCTSSASCAGKVCDATTGTCQNCTSSAECPESAAYCDTTTGACSATAPTCTSGTACGLENSGFCCASTCFEEGECCEDGDCTNSGNGDRCNMATHTCFQQGNCPLEAEPGRFYVDPDAPASASGKGSRQCPFRGLGVALSNLPTPLTSRFVICTRGTFDSTKNAVWPRYIPANVELDGRYCDAASNPNRTIFVVPAGNNAVSFRQAGPASIHGYEIRGADKTQNSGIFVSNSGFDYVDVSDVKVTGFRYGFHVGKGGDDASPGHLVIYENTEATGNDVGLRVNAGAGCTIVDVTALKKVQFNANDSQGIHVSTGTLYIAGLGTGDDTANPRTVEANSNGGQGLLCDSSDCSLNIDYFKANFNANAGIRIVNSATVRVRNSVFNANMGHGVTISRPDASNSSTASIDFGSESSLNAGVNRINGNTKSGLYVAFDNTDSPLRMKGNIWGNNKDCRDTGTHTASLTSSPNNCDLPYDVCGPAGGSTEGKLVQVAACGKIDCSVTPKPAGCP